MQLYHTIAVLITIGDIPYIVVNCATHLRVEQVVVWTQNKTYGKTPILSLVKRVKMSGFWYTEKMFHYHFTFLYRQRFEGR
jgi:hypothetical protein